MTTYYIGRYADEVGSQPNVNRNKARYLFEAILMDHNRDETKALIDYYVKHYEPDLDWFQWNYDKVLEAKAEYEKNQDIIVQRRQETARRVEEWKRRKAEWKN